MDEYIVGEYVLERSRSRTGKHQASSILLVYSRDKGFLSPSKASELVVEEREARPTYSRGSARSVKLRLKKGDYVVYGWFVKNFRGKVKGYIEVYSHRGELLYRAKYFDGVVRKSIGKPVHAWLVRLFIEKTRIPVREISLEG